MDAAKSGDQVQVHYTGTFDDGEVFDTSRKGDPLEFIAGGDQVIPGVSQAVIGMTVGETKTVNIPFDQGYGPREENLVQRVERKAIPAEAKVGEPLQATVNEQRVVFWVVELDEESVVLDANHPLAGRDLTFEMELISFEAP